MIYRTEIPFADVDEQELCDLVNQLARVSGQKIEIEKQIVVSTDSLNLSSMLDQLRDAIDNGDAVLGVPKKKAKAKTKKNNVKQVEGGEKPEPTRGPHVRSIKVNGSGEMISRFELNKRLAEHTIMMDTKLHSPKYGQLMVAAQTGDESLPYVVVDDDGHVV